MTNFVGIDFGTTNSAIAIASDKEKPKLLSFPMPNGENADTWRSVLFFEHGDDPVPDVSAGGLAIGRYLESGGDGRFIQSVKSHLASRLFSKTTILGRNFSLEALVATYLLQLRDVVDVDLGTTAVIGRPVQYWGATSEEDNERAITRMKEGLRLAGFTDVVLEHEPTAAAAKYGAGLSSEELVLIADFGGGTSDFCLLKMGAGRESEILATDGIGIGGDTFDGCLVDSLIAPKLGKGSSYSDAFGSSVEIPRTLFSKLRRWHHLAFLKSRKTQALLQRIYGGAEFPDRIARFMHVVNNDLGLPLHQSIERTKVSLSGKKQTSLLFQDPPIEIGADVTRVEFENWIARDLDKIDKVVDEILRKSGVAAEAVGCVFTTGGSSFVPAVRERLESRFPGRLRGGEEMTSVALGLAERARSIYS